MFRCGSSILALEQDLVFAPSAAVEVLACSKPLLRSPRLLGFQFGWAMPFGPRNGADGLSVQEGSDLRLSWVPDNPWRRQPPRAFTAAYAGKPPAQKTRGACNPLR